MKINLTGTGKIFRKDFDGKPVYSTSIGNKKEDGTYDNMFLQVQLPKEADVNNGDDITINNGFLSFYTDKNGNQKIKVVVMDYTNNTNVPEVVVGNAYNSDDLPF